MKIIINQFQGIGDIVFCMTIARRLQSKGHEITWPVVPQFLEGLKRAYPDILFCDWRTIPINYEEKGEKDVFIDGVEYRVLPLRWNVEIMNVPYSQCMASKYSMFGWDYKDWKQGAMWERDRHREETLYNLVRVKTEVDNEIYPTEGYTVVNRYFGSNSQFQVNIPLKGVEMKSIPGYSLFDYSLLLENAEHIHVANSSILYLLEMLDLKAKSINLYARLPQERDFKNTDYIHTKKYILHV